MTFTEIAVPAGMAFVLAVAVTILVRMWVRGELGGD